MSLKACASSRTSAGPSDGSARTVRSPPSARRVASRRSVSGRLTQQRQPASGHRDRERARRARPRPARASSAGSGESTRDVGTLARTAPCTHPARGHRHRDVEQVLPSVSERRVPVATAPSRAEAISGRVEKSRESARGPGRSRPAGARVGPDHHDPRAGGRRVAVDDAGQRGIARRGPAPAACPPPGRRARPRRAPPAVCRSSRWLRAWTMPRGISSATSTTAARIR